MLLHFAIAILSRAQERARENDRLSEVVYQAILATPVSCDVERERAGFGE